MSWGHNPLTWGSLQSPLLYCSMPFVYIICVWYISVYHYISDLLTCQLLLLCFVKIYPFSPAVQVIIPMTASNISSTFEPLRFTPQPVLYVTIRLTSTQLKWSFLSLDTIVIYKHWHLKAVSPFVLHLPSMHTHYHYHLVPLSSISLSLIHDPSSSITERNIAIISPWPIIIMCPWGQYYYYCIPSIISNDYISPPYSSHILYTHIILIMCPLSITCCPTQYFTHIYVWLSNIIYFLTLIYNI